MEWLQELVQREELLRKRLAELAQEQTPPVVPPASPGEFERAVRPTVEEIQALLDDYLCGRDAEERSWMSYEVRLNLPLFSHLRSMYCLASAAEA